MSGYEMLKVKVLQQVHKWSEVVLSIALKMVVE